MFWKILGIEETKDRKAITQAYREKLLSTNPEEKPEEFKQLRSAYEQALEYADRQEVSVMKTARNAVDLWRDELEELYNDYPARIQLDNWKKLLAEDVCTSLDSRMKVEEALLSFLMEHYFISHETWLYLDSQFLWNSRKQELYENYPRDFIDYVILNGINFPDTLKMDLFIPGKDGEQIQKYLNLYVRIRRGNRQQEDVSAMMDELLSLPEQHPYGTALSYSWRLFQGDESAMDEFFALYQQYPDDLHIASVLANELYQKKEYAKAREIAEKALKIQQEPQLKYLYANILAELEEYDDAVNQLNELMRGSGGNRRVISDLDETRQGINEKIISNKLKAIEDDPEDMSSRIDLSWAYLENNYDDKAEEIARTVVLEKADRFDYYNLMSNIEFVCGDKEKALENIRALIETISEMRPDGTEKTDKRIARLGEMYGRLGFYLFSMKRNEESEQVYRKALELASDKSDILTTLSQIALSRKEYEKVIEYTNQLIEARPDSFHGYLLQGYALFYLERDPECFDMINRAIDLNGSELESYIIKLRILIRNKALEQADELLKFLLENGLQDDYTVLLCQALLAQEKDDNDGAMEYYKKAMEVLGEETDVRYGEEIYYNYLVLRGEQLDARVEQDRKEMLELADRGLKFDPDHYGLRDYKAWLLIRENKLDESLEIYKSLEQDPDHGPGVEAQIGYIYYQDIRKNAGKSLEYYLKAIENNGPRSCYFYAGMCLMYLNRLDEAESMFLKLQQLEPDSLDSYYRLSYLYAMRNQLDRSLENINRTIEIVKDRKGDQSYYYYVKSNYLRRMNKPQEAIDTLNEMISKYNNHRGYRWIFDTYCQFGMFDEARRFFSRWRKVSDQQAELTRARILVEILCGNYIKASLMLMSNSAVMNETDSRDLEMMLYEHSGDYKKFVQDAEKCLNSDSDASRWLGQMAYGYFHLKMRTKQQVYAEKTLEELDKRLAETRMDEMLYMTRKVRALALANRRDDARELVRQIRNHRLCDWCPYHSCKDLEQFEMEMEIIAGNDQKAFEMAMFGKDRWPDEESFRIMADRLKKKVK